MELNWLEDFVELAAVRNFSTAAAARHISQPAFSRRIRALENWMGTELVDRGSYPVNLTKAGGIFLESCRDLMREIYRVRDECRQLENAGSETISCSALHTIALSIFPQLLSRVEKATGPFVTRMHATDFYDCVESLTLGRCDFAFCYSHTVGPPILQTGQFGSKKIGVDTFHLVSAVNKDGTPLFKPRASAETTAAAGGIPPEIPLVSYSADCFLGKVQAHLTRHFEASGQSFRTVYENSMSEAVKRMILTGKGVGWLPESAASREFAAGELHIIDDATSKVDLDVIAIRKQGAGSAAVERFWAHLPEVSAEPPPA